jgi:murein DD-endopeptidase MepM/ murein hydrolase activator NlpD
VGVVGFFTLASLLVVLLIPLARRGAPRSVAAASSASLDARYADSSGAGPLTHWSLWRAIAARRTRACQPASGPSDYVNPLGDARVRPERIDQGVDYAGSGALVAIGGATLTDVTTTDTGWPGSFIEYRLLDGPDAGCYVYYAEGVNPAEGLRVGQTVSAGQPIASIISGWPTGIELGWGAGISTATYAAETHQWSATSDQESVPSAAGKSFSALIASLGGPPGKVEG